MDAATALAPIAFPTLGGGAQAQRMPAMSPAEVLRLRNILDALPTNEPPWTIEELREWCLQRRRLKGARTSTLEQRLRDLRRMETHPVSPVHLHGSRQDLVETFVRFAHYRESVEGKASTALVNDFKAVKLLGAFRGVPKEVWPRPPPIVAKEKAVLPRPEEVAQVLHATYAADPRHSYEQHLVRALLAFNLGFGPRFPSEAHSLRVQDFDPERHLIVVTEPKKSGRRRRLYIEPEWLCCGRTRPSLQNYVKHWRPKVDVGGTDAFFLMPTGEPFASKESLNKWLNERVKPLFPWYHGYFGRHWCATARLIEWDFDYERVADWIGDQVERVRESYDMDARIHRKMYGGAWLERAFGGVYAQARGRKPNACARIPLEKKMLPAGSFPRSSRRSRTSIRPGTPSSCVALSRSPPLFPSKRRPLRPRCHHVLRRRALEVPT